MNPVFLTASEVASVLRISKALSYRLIKNGKIRSIRFGRSVRVKKDDLDAFIVKNAFSSSAGVVSGGGSLSVTGDSKEVTMQ